MSNASRALIQDVSRRVRNRYLEETRRRNFGGAYLYVTEYPKSGGTWVKNMLADVAAADPSSRRGPIIHNHWRHRETFRPAVYVVRDGRDIVVSFYFHHLRHLRPPYRSRRIAGYFDRHFGSGHDPDDIRSNLPAFIESLETHPLGALPRPSREHRFATWPQHVADWVPREGVPVVAYESLLRDPTGEVMRLAKSLGVELDTSVVTEIVRANSFQAVTGRTPGVEDPSSFYRKGVAGDWRNHFTTAAAEAFVRFGGATLRDLGYEQGNEWVQELPSL